jgi:hypothetical protein
MNAAFYYWRAARRRNRRRVLAVAIVCGLLGAVALAALAGARRTDSAYGRYLASIHASDVSVNVPGPSLAAVRQIEHLPGVESAAAWLGLGAEPVVHGRIDDSFVTDALSGSLDGEYFRQDRMTVIAGRLPRLDATDQIALTPQLARVFGAGVGGRVTYAFGKINPQTGATVLAGYSTFTVTAIVDIPPVLVDQFDDVAGAVLPPAATARHDQNLGFGFAWVALRLRAGTAGIPALQRELGGPEATLDRAMGQSAGTFSFDIRRQDVVHRQVQQAIEPQAIALAVFGGVAALALLVLVGQGLAQLVNASAAGVPAMRAVGATRTQTAVAISLDGALSIVGGVALAVVGAVAGSPLAPVGPVRAFDPARGFQADAVVLAGGAAALVVLLFAALAALTWRSVRWSAGGVSAGGSSTLAAAAAAAGLPVAAVAGIRAALERGTSRRPAPVLATLAGSAVAVLAVVLTLVFGASLDGLVTHPARYGWNWTLLMDSEGGYGTWPPSQMQHLVSGQPGVTGWSTFAFTQAPIDGQEVPVLGLTRYLGSVQPPTISGHPLGGPQQIELGAVTLRALGKHVGDTVTVGAGRHRRTLTIVGTVTLPSIGLALADHVSLGRGAMLDDSTLLATQGLPSTLTPQDVANTTAADPAFPSAVAIDLAPGTNPGPLVARIDNAGPGDDPGGTYEQPRVLGAAIVNASQMESQPLALALALAAAALLSLAVAVLASVRRGRRELALLKALGLTRRQVREIVAWQASVILVIACLAGLPLGILAGRWAWTGFAASLGVAPVTVVPGMALLTGIAALLGAGNLLAAAPASVAARTKPGVILRAE